MSTRSTTHFTYAAGTPTAIIYRHADGYPEGAGADIVKFLDRVGKMRDPRFMDPSYLAAKYVVFLAEMFHEYGHDKAEPLDFLSVGVCAEDPGDIQYRYVVTCDGTGENGRPRVQCFHANGFVNAIPDEDNGCWTAPPDTVVIIKGEIIVPKEKTRVTEFEI